MKYILSIYLAVTFLFTNAQTKPGTAISQRPKYAKTISLKVGDQVPDLLIPRIIHNDRSAAKITDFKDQLLILDFWETTCGTCIEALPKLDSIQKYFGNKIKILGVTWETEARVRKFFQTNKFLRGLKSPCIVEDQRLGAYFRHKIISHVVWIYKGKVISMTTTEYVTKENIATVLAGKTPTWPVKRDDLVFDPGLPIFKLNAADQYNQQKRFLSYSGLTGQREGVDYKDGMEYTADSVGHIYRTYAYNRSIVKLYHNLWFKISPKNFIPVPGRLFLEVKDPDAYVHNPKKDLLDQWKRAHEICYEMVTSVPLPEEQRLKLMVQDLNAKLGLDGRWEKRKTNSLVITRTKEIKNLDSINQSRKGYALNMQGLIIFFLDQTGKYPPAVDESEFKDQKIVIAPFDTLEELRQQLHVYGCDLIEAERELDVMVITETNEGLNHLPN